MDDQKNGCFLEIEKKPIDNHDSNQKLYKRRWLILLVFIIYTANAAVQWVQYTIIRQAVVRYYLVSAYAVDWTTECYMLNYVLFITPVLWLMNKLGLRNSLIVASGGVCIGTWIKAFAVFPNGFYLLMIGQQFQSIFQVFTFGFAIRLTAVWFGADEISLAGALSLFGDQFGTALGFIVPTLLVKNTNVTEIGQGLFNMNGIIAITSTIVFALVTLLVHSEPPKPPSTARRLQMEVEKRDVVASIKAILSNKSFLLVLFSYGLSMGTFNCFATTLNELFRPYFEDYDGVAGRCGFLVSSAGLVGSLVGGYYLDRSRKFKETTVFATLCCAISMSVFTFFVFSGNSKFAFVAAFIQGFFWMVFYTGGIQMAIEVCYPISEDVCAGLIALAVQGKGLLLTTIATYSIRNVGVIETCIGMVIVLLTSSILLMIVPSKMKRQQVEKTGDINGDPDVVKAFI